MGTLLAAMTAALIFDFAEQKEPPLRPTDERLELLVTEALAEDPEVQSYEILVVADGGEVALYGSVDSDYKRRRAERTAGGVEGVSEIDNEIQVVDPVSTADKSDEAIERDFWKSLGQRMETIPSNVEVRVQNGGVVLLGRVDSRAERRLLVDVAFDAGAVLVKPELEIEGLPDETRSLRR